MSNFTLHQTAVKIQNELAAYLDKYSITVFLPLQSQKAASSYFTSKNILHFGFA